MRSRALLLVSVVALLLACGRAPRREAIFTKEAPAPIGPYSQAIRVGPSLYVSGQLGIDPATGQLVAGGVAAETRQALENLRAIVRAAGFSMMDIVQCQVFLEDLGDRDTMNAAYAVFFPQDPPARATFEVDSLPRGARVEILATAVRVR